MRGTLLQRGEIFLFKKQLPLNCTLNRQQGLENILFLVQELFTCLTRLMNPSV